MLKKTPKTKNSPKNGSKTAASKTTQIDDLTTQLAQAQESAKTNWDNLLLAKADTENLKRRHAKSLEDAHKFALDGFVKALLEVNDSISMGLKSAADNANVAHLKEGLELTAKVFSSTLEKFGVATITPATEPFNPELHEAISAIPSPEKSNTILEVVQIGFTLNGRLIRPAMVVVAQ